MNVTIDPKPTIHPIQPKSSRIQIALDLKPHVVTNDRPRSQTIALDLKPHVVTEETKRLLIDGIQRRFNCSYVIGGNRKGKMYCYQNDGSVVLFNAQKYRRKAKFNKATGKKTPVRRAKWVAHVYVVPKSFVKDAIQGPRHFRLTIG